MKNVLQDPNGHRMRLLHCEGRGLTMNRDVNAARNVRDRGRLRFSLIEPLGEAMVQELSHEAILKVDGGRLRHHAQQTQ
ncbi:MAG: transposase [Thaumarchaeota archaeon]|nr:transposase [Nitrososphaerota archaeon]MCL5316762.1 transposase [Nitrososphaerota archaeon]